MSTNYEMWITGNGEAEKLMIPVLPEKFSVTVGSKNQTVDVTGLGEIIVKQSRPAYQFSFSSFFPAGNFPGMAMDGIKEPSAYVEMLKGWHEGDKPVHLVFPGLQVDTFATIEKFTYYEEGGDVGTIYYDLNLKEYREITVRKVKIGDDGSGSKATVQKAETRVDNTTPPKTYTVKYGDCLWNIAKKYYGDGSKYKKIYEANKSVIDTHHGGPNMIWPGDKLTIP